MTEALCSLRPLRGDDAPAVLDAFASAPDMARQGEVRTPEQAAAYVAHLTEPGSGRQVFAVTVEDRLVGVIGVAVDRVNRTGWFWYWMHAAQRGRGWTSSAATTVADWALDDGGCERLELGHRVNNPASGRVAQAAGFVLEGRERERFLIDGKRIDVLTYGRLRTDPVPAGPRLALRTTPVASPSAAPGLHVAVEAAGSLDGEEVLALYDAVGWAAYTRDSDQLMRALTGSHRLVTARDGGRLVGLARSISDGHSVVYVQDVLVWPEAQRSGIGTHLLTVLLDPDGAVRQQVLLTDAEDRQRAFYESLGFTEAHDMSPELRAFIRLRSPSHATT